MTPATTTPRDITAEDLSVAATPQQVSSTVDEVVPVSVLPEQSVGWSTTSPTSSGTTTGT